MNDNDKIAMNTPPKKTVLSKLFFAIYILALFSLLLSYLAPYISPEKFWLPAFFGLIYPVILIINIFFMIWWAIRRKKKFFLALIVILSGWVHIRNLFQINLTSSENSTDKIKVMSWNVHVFDLYNWKHNKETRNKIFDLIAEEAPAIICLQEVYSDDNRKFVTLDTLAEIQTAKYFHSEFTTTANTVHHFGIATFSKYPIVQKGKIEFHTSANNICIYTDLKIGNDTVRVYNMHLQSVLLKEKDYKFIEAVVENKKSNELESSKNILRRLKLAFMKRAIQADLVKDHIDKCPYPVIVCGDFNDTPASYAYHTLSQNLTDAFTESGNGFGKTYNWISPFLRIDYIFYSEQFSSSDYQTLHDTLSDHFPIECNLMKKPAKNLPTYTQ